jgi:predicted nucleotidyltransferase
MTKFGDLIRLLVDAGVEFIIVGGVAAAAHGATRTTLDLDLVYERAPENLARVVHALAGSAPYPRGAPPGLPFFWDAQTLLNGLNFTLQTALGDVDLLGEITGGGSYPDLLPHSIEIVIFDRRCRCIDLETLVRVKRAAGRPKDYEAIAELEILLGRRRS